MTSAERVSAWFARGELVHPCDQGLSFADLARAIRWLGESSPRPADERAAAVAGLLGEARHYLLVLIDGLGAELLDRLPRGAFLRERVVERLRAVFPATTASALTTLATGLWPYRHCIPGWFTRLPREGVTAVTLPFTERTSGEPLGRFGVEPAALFPEPSIWPSLGLQPHALMPHEIAESTYARYFTGETSRYGFANLDQAAELAADLLRRAQRPAFVYLYVPDLDALIHDAGCADRRVGELLLDLDRRLERLARALPAGARLVVCSDHGLIDVPRERITVLGPRDPLVGHMLCQPTGEPSVPLFHLRPGHEEAFAQLFAERFDPLFALLSADQAQELQLYGPGALAPEMRARLGSFIGIAREPAKLYVEPVSSSAKHRAIHGGLRGSEMVIPLVVA